MITSRGCPFDCNFCSIHSVMGFKLRLRSVDNIIIEIEELKKRFNLDEIWFEDDNLTGDIKRAKDLFRNIIDRDLGITFYARNGLRPDNLDNEMLTLMKKAGFKEIALAPESASQRTLDEIINKRLQLEDLERVIIMAKDTGLKTNCFLVIGFPEENLDDVKRTVEYGSKLRKLGSSLIFISCATPYPGTRLFSECIEKGIIDPEDFDFRKLSTFDSVIHNDFFSAADLAVMRSKAENKLNKFEKTRQNIFKIKYFFTEPIWFIKKAFYKIKLTILHKVKITKAI